LKKAGIMALSQDFGFAKKSFCAVGSPDARTIGQGIKLAFLKSSAISVLGAISGKTGWAESCRRDLLEGHRLFMMDFVGWI